MDDAFEVIGARLVANAAETLIAWLPKGRRQGREWCVGSLAGEPGQSLKVNIDSGRWQDFSTGEKGGDLISLYAALHGLSQGDALQQLGGDDLQKPNTARRGNGHAAGLGQEPDSASDASPVERATQTGMTSQVSRAGELILPHFKHLRHGMPAYVYPYRNSAGELLCVVARYEHAQGKEFCPWTWDGEGWRPKAPDKPRPLYGLDRLARLDRRVVVVEGEKAAEALQAVVRRSPVITWPGGANSWKHADWAPLQGRSVLLWPDADPPGVAAMQGIAGLLLGLGCAVERVDVDGLTDGFDAADLIGEGMGGAAVLNEWLRPRLRPVPPVEEAPKEPQRVAVPQAPAAADGTPRVYDLARLYDLAVGRQGILNSAGNVGLLLAGCIADRGWFPLWWDEFLQRRMGDHGEWTDEDDDAVLIRIHNELQLHNITAINVQVATRAYARNHARSCARDWLRSLTWDGTPRLDELMTAGFGGQCAGLTERPAAQYLSAVGRCFVMGMVARVMRPGCQLDNLPVFEGPQGARKSKALRLLGGQWHAEVHEDIRNKDFYLSLAGKMLVEISEFQSFKRGDIEMVKAVISRPTDRYRVPFARSAADHPRRCAFAATTNDYRWNLDPTGARRFWPVRCGNIDLDWISAQRVQLFAEAVQLLDAGGAWWDVPEDLAVAEQRARYNLDAIELPVKRYLGGRNFVTILSIMSDGLGLEHHQRYDTMLTSRVLSLLTRWRWRESSVTDDSGQTFEGFIPPEPAAAARSARPAQP